jgi:hypothetical protein
MPSSPSLRAPASVSSVWRRKSSFELADASTVSPARESEADVVDLAAHVDAGKL